jgi:phage terminase large subunit
LVRGMDEIWADCAEPKSIRELKDAGWLIRGASKGTDSVRKGIDLMKQYKINITEDSLNIIKDFRYYRWQRDKQTDKLINKPLAGWDHGTDAARYICMMKLGKKKRFLKQWN